VINNQNWKITSELKAMNDRHIEELSNVNKQLLQLNSNFGSKSYASAVRSTAPVMRNKRPENVIIIRSKDTTKTSKKTEELTKNIVLKNKLKTGVQNINSITKGGIALKCGSDQDLIKIMNTIRDQEPSLEVNKPIRKCPKIFVYNVSAEVDESDILDDILENNPLIKDYIVVNNKDIDNEIKIKFKFRHKNNSTNRRTTDSTISTEEKILTNTYVFELSHDLKKDVINKMPYIKIGWTACQFENYVQITKCFKCNGFGHISTVCRQVNDSCGLCGGGHKTKECVETNVNFCTNCDKVNKKITNGSKLSTNHTCFSSKCETLKRIKTLVISRSNDEY
jgi:hypothetical protein